MTDSAPPISVVIPLFNKRHCIERALRSVLEQTVPCREILVVDDGSTDGGHRVVQEMTDRRIRLLRQDNQGPSAARNKGIEETHGEFIAFLDADDEWKPGFLESIVRLGALHPQAGAYAAAYEVQEPDGYVHTHSYREIPPPPWEGIIPNYFRSAIGHTPVWTSAVVVRREVLAAVGGFVRCRGVGEDAELWARIALRYPIAFTWRVGAVYHKEAENSYCETVFTHVFALGTFERALRDPDVPAHLLPDVREYLAREKLVAASRYILGGQSRIARNILRECRTQRFLRQRLWWWLWSLLPSRLVRLAWRSKRRWRTRLRSWTRGLCCHR